MRLVPQEFISINLTMSVSNLLKSITYQTARYFTITGLIFLISMPGVSAGETDRSDRSSPSAAPEGGLRQTSWTDMLPHTMTGDYYNEFWSYHFFFEEDLHLHLTFSLANFGSLKSPVSGGKLFVSNFKGSNYNVAREFSLDHFTVDEERHKIRLHSGRDIYLHGKLPYEHHVYFSSTKDGVSYLVDLDFHDIHQGYTWGDGIFRLESEDMGIFVHIPRAEVSGIVAINKDTLHVSGTAYMDHTYQTNLSSKVVNKGFRHISHPGDGFHTGYYLVPKKRSRADVIGFSLKRENSPTHLEKAEKLTVLDSDRIGGRSVPRHVEVVFESGSRSVFSRQHDFQHVSFLEEIGGIRRRLVRSFLGGEVIEYVGTGKIDGNVPINYNFFLVH
jgi:hypothetical protein